jgi:hypothetical protein
MIQITFTIKNLGDGLPVVGDVVFVEGVEVFVAVEVAWAFAAAQEESQDREEEEGVFVVVAAEWEGTILTINICEKERNRLSLYNRNLILHQRKGINVQ